MAPAAAIVLTTLWLLGLRLLARMRPPGAAKHPSRLAPAKLAIVIPARDEADNLPALLDSIPRGDGGPAEIVVVDDDSSDGTADVARAGGARVVGSEPLPEGWRGKTWACHQGAAATTAPHLLFLDADTWFEPGGLELLLSQYDSGALSACP